LEDGTIFDSSRGRDPLEFTVGENEVIPGFEAAVVGMNPGDSKTIVIPADEAYGPHLEEMVAEVDRDQFPEGMILSLDQQLELSSTDGRTLRVRIIGLSPDSVTLDANHPLAGRDLTFDLQLVGVED
jgi:peptidylprolyl isomerase